MVCNVLMMPDVMRQFGLVLTRPTNKRAPPGINNARSGLASYLTAMYHPVMNGATIGLDAITNWIIQIQSDAVTYAEWLKGCAARGRADGPAPPSHHKAAFELMEIYDKFVPPSQHRRYTEKPANAPADAELIKDDGAMIQEDDDNEPAPSAHDAQKEAITA